MSLFSRKSFGSADPLPGRDTPGYAVPDRHAVLQAPLKFSDPKAQGLATVGLGMGCFWGAEKVFWQLPGVVSTAVGYQGGSTPNPTYEEVCSDRTGHAEVVQVTYDPTRISLAEILTVFWENHDPTQGNRQGNDIGHSYRSLIVADSDALPAVEDSARRYGEALRAEGFDPVTTEILPSDSHPFYYAEPYHQQYLQKVPNGYDCHSSTGVQFPG